MAKLIITLDGQQIREVELDKERITIGRKPSNDVQIDNLAISGEHAAIVTLNGESFVEDLGSTNSTLVNNRPVMKQALQHGDEIEIGKYRLKYVNLEALEGKKSTPEIDAQDFEKTLILRRPLVATPLPEESSPADSLMAHTLPLSTPGTVPVGNAASPAPTPASAPASAPAPAPAPAPAEKKETHAAIQILNGPNIGRELDLVKTLTSLGKPGVQVAVITKRPLGYFLTHVQGDLHPAVNGQVLDAHPRQLMDHDIIELAGVKMEFYFK
ncbi:MAG: FHA domain-containing protein [Betaproteobacteria bacterium]|nr:FHA domain-containing protein [Betaproteobacteria bacterium]